VAALEIQRAAARALLLEWRDQLKQEAKLGQLREAARVQPERRAVSVVRQVAPAELAELQQEPVAVVLEAPPRARVVEEPVEPRVWAVAPEPRPSN